MASRDTPAPKSKLPLVIIGGVLVAAVVAAAWLLNSSDSANTNLNVASNSKLFAPVASPAQSSPVASNVTSTGTAGAQPAHVRGPAEAPVTIEEFADFQCPPCANLHPQMKRIEAEYGSRLRVVFRHAPLPMHQHADEAALAAEAAGMQGRFWQMHDLLFERQSAWKDEPDVISLFTTYASTLGLDAEKFKADMLSMQATSRVAADLARGRSLNVNGTPTLFINGREVATEAFIPNVNGLRAQIDALLAAEKK